MKAGDSLDGCQSSHIADLYNMSCVMVPKLVPESTGPQILTVDGDLESE